MIPPAPCLCNCHIQRIPSKHQQTKQGIITSIVIKDYEHKQMGTYDVYGGLDGLIR